MGVGSVYAGTEDMQRNLNVLKDKIKSLEDRISSDRSQYKKFNRSIKRIDEKIKADSLKKYRLSERKRKLFKRITDSEREITSLRSQMSKRKQEAEQWLSLLWIQSNQTPADSLWQEEQVLSLSDLHFYASYAYELYQETIKALEKDYMKEQGILEEQALLKEEIESLEKGLKLTLSNLLSEKSDQTKIIEQLSLELSKNKQEHNRLRESQRALDETIRKLKARSLSKDRKIGKINYPPVKGAVELYGFGDLLQDGLSRSKGVFFKTSQESKVYSVEAGVVAFTGWLSAYGWVLIIDHGSKIMSIYGNLETILLEEGANVRKGEQIAFAGNSGGKSYRGLYFEIRKQGIPKNPVNM